MQLNTYRWSYRRVVTQLYCVIVYLNLHELRFLLRLVIANKYCVIVSGPLIIGEIDWLEMGQKEL